MILEEAPARKPLTFAAQHVPRLLCLSTDDDAGIERAAKRLNDNLSARRDQLPAIEELLHALHGRRSHHAWRSAAVVTTPQSLIKALPSMSQGAKHVNLTYNIAFAFSGQGAQYTGMGTTLCRDFPVSRKRLDNP